MKTPVLHLHGTVIIDDHTEVSDMWVQDGRFLCSEPSQVDQHLEGYFLPGLVDVHCHIGLDGSGAVDRDTAEAQATANRNSGVLLIRDAGSPSDTSWIDGRDDLPRMIRCGQHIARPKRYIRNYGQELTEADNLAAAIVENLAHSDGWNKIVADWIEREVGDLTPLWSPAQLHAGISAAHERGGRVTAHTFSGEAIGPLLDAGIDCIEHGTGMTADDMARASAAGVAVTPTLLQIEQFEKIAAAGDGKYPKFAARMRAMHSRRYEQTLAFHDAGMQILVGTDAGGTIEHGRIADECRELELAGIPAPEIVAYASWRARAFLGQPGIVEGASADVVCYDSDPRENISVLKRPTAVILRGVVCTE